AGDERAREVRPCHSSEEAAERSRATGRGGSGAKGGGRGKRGPALHAPGAEPGTRDPGAGPRTASSKAKEEGAVHRASPPGQSGHVATGVLRAEAQSGARRRWRDVAGLRGGSRATARRSACTGPPRSVPTPSVPPEVHTESRRS